MKKNSFGSTSRPAPMPAPAPAPRMRTVVNVATGQPTTGIRFGLPGSKNYISLSTGQLFRGNK